MIKSIWIEWIGSNSFITFFYGSGFWKQNRTIFQLFYSVCSVIFIVHTIGVKSTMQCTLPPENFCFCTALVGRHFAVGIYIRQCAIIHCSYNSYNSYKYYCKYLRLQKSIEIFPRESEYSLGKFLDVLWPESALPTLLLDSPFLKILMDLLG